MGSSSKSSPRRPPSAAGSTSKANKANKGGKGGLTAVHSLLSTFWGAILAALVGYLVGYFAQNDRTTPGETYRRLLRSVRAVRGMSEGTDSIIDRS